MKEILEDAVFFAEWIPMFFWQQKDRESWRKSGSTYVIAKPVDTVMNSILQGESLEQAFAKFISLLKEDISRDKNAHESIAKVDVKDLKIFTKKAKEIFSRYTILREENISRFIKAKNGLRSAIYILKRYPDLKEVIR